MSSASTLGRGQAVEQRRLAGIGVADQRDDRIRHAPAARAVQAARLLDASRDRARSASCAPGSGAGRPRSGSRRGRRGSRSRRAGARDGSRSARAGSSGSRDGRARPAARPRCVRARRPKISRIRPVRSMTLAPQAFSRLRCCTGDSAQSITTRPISSAAHEPGDLLDLALAEIGRRPQRRRATTTIALDDVEVDRGGKPDRLVEARLGGARVGGAARSAGPPRRTACGARDRGRRTSVARARARRPSRGSRRAAARRSSPRRRAARVTSGLFGAPRPPGSNSCTGWPGMMVEIACL